MTFTVTGGSHRSSQVTEFSGRRRWESLELCVCLSSDATETLLTDLAPATSQGSPPNRWRSQFLSTFPLPSFQWAKIPASLFGQWIANQRGPSFTSTSPFGFSGSRNTHSAARITIKGVTDNKFAHLWCHKGLWYYLPGRPRLWLHLFESTFSFFCSLFQTDMRRVQQAANTGLNTVWNY